VAKGKNKNTPLKKRIRGEILEKIRGPEEMTFILFEDMNTHISTSSPRGGKKIRGHLLGVGGGGGGGSLILSAAAY